MYKKIYLAWLKHCEAVKLYELDGYNHLRKVYDTEQELYHTIESVFGSHADYKWENNSICNSLTINHGTALQLTLKRQQR